MTVPIRATPDVDLLDPAIYYRVNFWSHGLDWFVGAYPAPGSDAKLGSGVFVFFTTRSKAVARMVAAEQQVRLNVARKLMGIS